MFKDLFSNVRTIYQKVLAEKSLKLKAADAPKMLGSSQPDVYNIPPDVYEQLMAFKTKRELKSVEIAVTVILEEYFRLQPSRVDETHIAASRLETLEAKCTSLTETVAELQAAIATLQASNSDSPPQVELAFESDSSRSQTTPNSEASDVQAENLSPELPSLTSVALAKRLGTSTSSISRMQSKPNFSEWSRTRDPEGIAWVKSLDTKLFYPQTADAEQLYKPGEIVPQSGQYELIDPNGGSQRQEVTATKGEHFPPTPETGMRYKLVDLTKHKKM